MRKVGIITDSNSGIKPDQAKDMGISVVPMPFIIGEETYYEEISLSRKEFFQRMEEGQKIVTSQEAIDSVTKISGDDFSKIQGRFNTRLSLSSSSVDEVIKRRILAKTPDAENLLRMVYDENSAILKNLFTFNDAVADLKGYAGENDFVETYPFVPYQFRLMQNVLAQIRKHGNSGKHL